MKDAWKMHGECMEDAWKMHELEKIASFLLRAGCNHLLHGAPCY